MLVRHKLFREQPAYWTDSDTGAPVVNDRDQLATDEEVFRMLNRPDCLAELDRLTREMCEAERAAGNTIPPLLMQAELDAFKRDRRRRAS